MRVSFRLSSNDIKISRSLPHCLGSSIRVLKTHYVVFTQAAARLDLNQLRAADCGAFRMKIVEHVLKIQLGLPL
jgi:hypothetical protein